MVLLLDVSRVLLHELGEADVVGTEAAEAVQDAGLARVQERQFLGHLREKRAVKEERSERGEEGRAGAAPAALRACSR